MLAGPMLAGPMNDGISHPVNSHEGSQSVRTHRPDRGPSRATWGLRLTPRVRETARCDVGAVRQVRGDLQNARARHVIRLWPICGARCFPLRRSQPGLSRPLRGPLRHRAGQLPRASHRLPLRVGDHRNFHGARNHPPRPARASGPSGHWPTIVKPNRAAARTGGRTAAPPKYLEIKTIGLAV